MTDDRRDVLLPGQPPPSAASEVRELGQDSQQSLRLLAEELQVTKELQKTGRVHVKVVTHEHRELVELPLARERVEVERVAVNQPIGAIPAIRQDGDVTIVPIVEETLVVERRLVLKEELRIRRVRTTEQYREHVVLRRQEAVVTRTPIAEPADTPSSAPKVNQKG